LELVEGLKRGGRPRAAAMAAELFVGLPQFAMPGAVARPYPGLK
jgi:hypothetical protein